MGIAAVVLAALGHKRSVNYWQLSERMLQSPLAVKCRKNELQQAFLCFAKLLPWGHHITMKTLPLYLLFIVNNFDALREIYMSQRKDNGDGPCSEALCPIADKAREIDVPAQLQLWTGVVIKKPGVKSLRRAKRARQNRRALRGAQTS